MQSARNLLSLKRPSLFKVLAAIALTTIWGAASSKANLISNGSTFDISVWGFTGRGGSGASEQVVGTINATFGGTYVYPGEVLGSTQPTVVTSSESVVGGVYTDTITISVPNNFDEADLMIAGQPIQGLFMDIGEAVEVATTGPTTQNGLQLNTAINPAYQSAYGMADSTFNGPVTIVPPPTTSFNGGDTQQYAYEGVEPIIPGDIAPNGFYSFTYVTTVPEPVSAGLMGVVGLGLLRRRRV